ncbi:hypothetical protein KR067_001916 [Drosophila pandora]|nr:hypothetical protein KR067_001916 [Drosophila pandora]
MVLQLFFVISFCISVSLLNAQNISLRNILKTLDKELSYQTILLLQGNNECWNGEPFLEDTPVLIINQNKNLYQKDLFNTNLIAFVCLEENKTDIMEVLYSNLEDIRETPIILLAFSETQIRQLFVECNEHEILNVLAFIGSDRSLIHSFRKFPKFQIIKRNVSEVRRYFEPQLKDLGGHVLRALPDNVIPRTVVYRDAHGNRQLAGYLNEFIKNYVSTINASLEIVWDSVPEHGMMRYEELIRKSEEANVDFPLAEYGVELESSQMGMAIEMSSWWLILPMEPNLPRSRYFLNVGLQGMAPMALIMAVVLCNAHRMEAGLGPSMCCFYNLINKAIRGILAQPFVLPRHLSLKLMLIYWLLFQSGFFLANYYTANLATWLMHPPAGNYIRSWEELRSSGLKILMIYEDYNLLKDMLGKEFVDALRDVFVLTDNTMDFQGKRLWLDQSYGYPVTNTLWPILQISQERLHQPIFRRSNEIVFKSIVILSLPVSDNCIFKKSLHNYFLRTSNSGLLDLWFRQSFFDLVRLRKIWYKKESDFKPYQDLMWQDFFYIWLTYIGVTFLSIIIFLLELGYHRWQAAKILKNSL